MYVLGFQVKQGGSLNGGSPGNAGAIFGKSRSPALDKKPPLAAKITSFEGAKGLSAQHVFIVGIHEGELPRDSNNIRDIEICKFLVGLTRTKKKCTLILTRRFGADMKNPSPFISWINPNRYEIIQVNAGYWATR